jgi:hypothetical protein
MIQCLITVKITVSGVTTSAATQLLLLLHFCTANGSLVFTSTIASTELKVFMSYTVHATVSHINQPHISLRMVGKSSSLQSVKMEIMQRLQRHFMMSGLRIDWAKEDFVSANSGRF